MKNVTLAIALMACIPAAAELKMVQKPQPIFIASNGEQVNAVEALKRSIKGETIVKCTALSKAQREAVFITKNGTKLSGDELLKCDRVEAQASESGNISMKKVN